MIICILKSSNECQRIRFCNRLDFFLIYGSLIGKERCTKYSNTNQKEGGIWQGTQRGREIPETCFAILFLERAMKVATGSRKK